MAVGNNNQIEKRLWDAADEMRANSKLKSSEYSIPVLGLIFLRYADQKFATARKELEGKGTGLRQVGKSDYQAKGVLYLPEAARFQNLLQKPEGANIGQAINDAMRATEGENPDFHILATPPINVSDWGRERLREDKRWKYGVPPVENPHDEIAQRSLSS